MTKIASIPADNQGGKLWIKDFRKDGKRMFLQYKSTYNNMPFMETEVYFDQNEKLIICGGDGAVLFRFSFEWITRIVEDKP
jgi:hypothetical protein